VCVLCTGKLGKGGLNIYVSLLKTRDSRSSYKRLYGTLTGAGKGGGTQDNFNLYCSRVIICRHGGGGGGGGGGFPLHVRMPDESCLKKLSSDKTSRTDLQGICDE
jgi:hypothetical protein